MASRYPRRTTRAPDARTGRGYARTDDRDPRGRVSNPDHFPALAHSADSRKAPVGDEEQVSRHGRRANAPRRATHDNHYPPKKRGRSQGSGHRNVGPPGVAPGTSRVEVLSAYLNLTDASAQTRCSLAKLCGPEIQ